MIMTDDCVTVIELTAHRISIGLILKAGLHGNIII